uniref:Cupin 2 conserved barrel domain-containing protein n=1 Tax=Phaeomonas parva TaxID=124430 RepID=A0A7S1U2L0_9STRA|mmetsp:Transcript_27549/g.87218  ORF Transcript_27549/g.87218 Transcript_27549/m.87218 type:complete len:392 (+) Transcript_27549:85-1260(+)
MQAVRREVLLRSRSGAGAGVAAALRARIGARGPMTTRTATTEAMASPTKKMRLEGAGRDTNITEAAAEPVRIFEYTSAANPDMAQIPVAALEPATHQSGETRIIPFDLSEKLHVPYPATSPNLMAAFLRINPNEELPTKASATSQAFYVIRGSGRTASEHGTIEWNGGDLFVFPATEDDVTHTAGPDSDVAIYWITDEPLLRYLGVKPSEKRFKPAHYTKERMLAEVERVSHEDGAEHRNRMGILLGNDVTEAEGTLTLTHTLWSLLNVLPAGDAQRPHRHNSVALDLCVDASVEGVYTLMGPELNEDGWVKDPIRCDWTPGGVFVTPPGWWHSHHNESDKPAWVLPIQDAGLYTHQRTLDIRFSPPAKTDNPPAKVARATPSAVDPFPSD